MNQKLYKVEKVKTNEHGEVLLNAEDVFNALYQGKSIQGFAIIEADEVASFNNAVKINADSFDKLKVYTNPDESIQLFDEANQCTWFMPEEYINFPIVEWLYEKCTTEEQLQRVDEELKLFIQHGMFDLLFYLKYLVDTMRSNNIVWGVGRGSSVSSYVLYLLGIHKIDSIKYGLDIHEFMK